MNVTPHFFETEEEAIADARALGLFTTTVDVPALNSEPHWHDHDSMFYLLRGELKVEELESGAIHVCSKGGRLHLNGYTAHRESTEGYRAVIGFTKSPDPVTGLPDPLFFRLPVVKA